MTTEDAPPMVVFVISNAISPDVNQNGPIPWQVGQPHPLVKSMLIRGIFVTDGGVEIYAEPPGDKCTRSFIPMHWILYVHETMSRNVFESEYEDAQLAVDDEYDPDPDPEPGDGADPDGRETVPPTGPNGQPSP